jgi:hypothetical protein
MCNPSEARDLRLGTRDALWMGSDVTGPPPDIAPRSVRAGFLPPSKSPVPSLSSGLQLPPQARPLLSPFCGSRFARACASWTRAIREATHESRHHDRRRACSLARSRSRARISCLKGSLSRLKDPLREAPLQGLAIPRGASWHMECRGGGSGRHSGASSAPRQPRQHLRSRFGGRAASGGSPQVHRSFSYELRRSGAAR